MAVVTYVDSSMVSAFLQLLDLHTQQQKQFVRANVPHLTLSSVMEIYHFEGRDH